MMAPISSLSTVLALAAVLCISPFQVSGFTSAWPSNVHASSVHDGRGFARKGGLVRRAEAVPIDCYATGSEKNDSSSYVLDDNLKFLKPTTIRSSPPGSRSWRTFHRNMTWLNRAWCPPAESHEAVTCQTAPVVKREFDRADVIDVDLFDAKKETIRAYREKGKIVSCYISVGTIEDWRADVQSNPKAWRKVSGNLMGSWPGETWIDIRKLDDLAPLMEKRIELAVEKGCDALEPDNMDCWLADRTQLVTCGGGIAQACSPDIQTYDPKNVSTHEFRNAQIEYLTWLADTAHSHNLAIGYKNNFLLAEELMGRYDFAVAEGAYDALACFQPFVEDGKPVFVHDYTVSPKRFSNDTLLSTMSQEEFCRRSVNGSDWMWTNDNGSAFCKLCEQIESMGFGTALGRKEWSGDTWANCADYKQHCEKQRSRY